MGGKCCATEQPEKITPDQMKLIIKLQAFFRMRRQRAKFTKKKEEGVAGLFST